MQSLPQSTVLESDATVCAERLLEALPPVMRFVRKHIRDSRARGLSLPGYRAMVLLHTAPQANMSAVAEYLCSSLPTASRIVSCLVKKGLVVRRESAGDRRQVKLALTPKGSAILEKSQAHAIAELAAVFDALPPEDARCLLNTSATLRRLFTPQMYRGD